MAGARRRHDWQRTSLLCATVANTARDAKKRPEPFTADDFDPTRPRPVAQQRPGIEAFGALVGMSEWKAKQVANGSRDA